MVRTILRILANVGRTWERSPTEVPTLGIGTSRLVTISEEVLYIHDEPYLPAIPDAVSIPLADITISQLVTTLASKGYIATVDYDGAGDLPATCLMPIVDSLGKNLLTTFSSPTWLHLYPIASALAYAESMCSQALQEAKLLTASGAWVDYWASFFGIRRDSTFIDTTTSVVGETDRRLVQRMMLLLYNTKINNIAIQEVAKFSAQVTSVTITDYAPAVFKVEYSDDGIYKADLIYSIILASKGAGIDFRMFSSVVLPSVIVANYASHSFLLNVSSLNDPLAVSVSDTTVIAQYYMEFGTGTSTAGVPTALATPAIRTLCTAVSNASGSVVTLTTVLPATSVFTDRLTEVCVRGCSAGAQPAMGDGVLVKYFTISPLPKPLKLQLTVSVTLNFINK